MVYPRRLRVLLTDAALKSRNAFRVALHMHNHAARIIPHLSHEPVFTRQPVDKRTKAHALNNSGNA